MASLREHDEQKTRQRLLDAAEAEFSENGFHKATIRNICKRADANVAAVNYHFRDKEDLYLQVFRRVIKARMVDSLMHVTATKDPPEKRLSAFIHTFMHNLLSTQAMYPQTRIMIREIMDPTPALDEIVKDGIRPVMEILRGIVAQLMNLPETDRRVRLVVGSVIGQMTFYRHAQPLIVRVFPDIQYDDETIAGLADHVTAFSLAAIQKFKPTSVQMRKY